MDDRQRASQIGNLCKFHIRELTSNCLLEGTLKQDLVELVESRGNEKCKEGRG